MSSDNRPRRSGNVRRVDEGCMLASCPEVILAHWVAMEGHHGSQNRLRDVIRTRREQSVVQRRTWLNAAVTRLQTKLPPPPGVSPVYKEFRGERMGSTRHAEVKTAGTLMIGCVPNERLIQKSGASDKELATKTVRFVPGDPPDVNDLGWFRNANAPKHSKPEYQVLNRHSGR